MSLLTMAPANGVGWQPPSQFRVQLEHETPEQRAWRLDLPRIASRLAVRWGLQRDGRPWCGWMSSAWPVRDDLGRKMVLKISWPDARTRLEQVALRAWAGPGSKAVRLWHSSQTDNAVVLRRLDADRTLEQHPDVDDACRIIAETLASLPRSVHPIGIVTVQAEAARMLDSIERQRDKWGSVVERPYIEKAIDTLMTVASSPVNDRARILHFDAHFFNVLHTLDDEPPDWILIDPNPVLGPVQWELPPVLRNRADEAYLTGDPERALRRRVDIMCDVLGANRSQARAIAQASAVDNLLWLLPEQPTHPFVGPYTFVSRW